ncbi:MAG TPA: sporulation protein [Candidatus Obscuribacterales bacterium]
MFDKMLSKIGIGAAKVDTVLHEAEVMRGEVLTGEVRMVGGKSAQKINQVYLDLQTQYVEEGSNGFTTHTHTLHRLEIADAFTLDAGEEVVYDFELQIPLETPISFGSSQSWVQTGLDVSWAFDPKDHDPIQVLPDPASDMVLGAAEELGFIHSDLSGRCLAMETPFDSPFVQVFEMKSTGPIAQHVEYLNILIAADDEQAHVQLDIDRRHGGMLGWVADGMGRDVALLDFSVPHDAEFGTAELEDILRQAVGH